MRWCWPLERGFFKLVLGPGASGALAQHYVASERFFACSPEMIDLLVAQGVAFVLAIAVWVLKHCLYPRQDMARIAGALAPHGGPFLVNQHGRAIPTVELGWVSDGADIAALLRETFAFQASWTSATRRSLCPPTPPGARSLPRLTPRTPKAG
jgi:hypothetical protein